MAARIFPTDTKTIKVVVLSLFAATTFWFFNAMNKSYDTRVDYPLSYTFAEDSVVVMEPLAKQIKIDVTSARSRGLTIRNSGLQIISFSVYQL